MSLFAPVIPWRAAAPAAAIMPRAVRRGPLSLVAGLVILIGMHGHPLAAEETQAGRHPQMEQHETSFGRLPDGSEARLFTCTAGGLKLALTDYGARIVSLEVPDRQGRPANVVLGFDSVDKYRAHTEYFGCTTGRYANRIARGQFTLNGKQYQLATNNGPESPARWQSRL